MQSKSLSIYFFLQLFLLTSCADFLWRESKPSNIEVNAYTCSYENNKIILSPSDEIARAAKQFFIEHKQINDTEQLIYLTLLHMRFFPHQVSPSTSLLFIEQSNDKQNVYMNNFSIQNKYPLLHFLNFLSKKNGKSLSHYLNFLQNNFVNTSKVTPSLHRFVKSHLDVIKKNEDLAAFYLRGNDPINIGESLPTLNLSFLTQLDQIKEKELLGPVYFFPVKEQEQLRCNFDSNLYHNTIYPSREEGLETLNFALLGPGKKSLYLSLFQKRLEPLTPQKSSPFFENSPHHNFPAICINHSATELNYALSVEGRDPAQHLHHLIKLGLFETKAPNTSKMTELQYLNRARFLYLNNPRRMLVESHLAPPKMLSDLLSENLPLYHMMSLGEIIINNAKLSEIHIDSRSKFEQKCSLMNNTILK
jgi:hypothetical protein